MNWQDKLQEKVDKGEITLKKEGKNDSSAQRNNSLRNRSSSRRRSNVNLSDIRKKINNVKEKGGKGMITVDAALKDLEAIEKDTTDAGAKAIVKGLKVVVKFLSTMRSNQLLTDEDKRAIAKARKERQSKETNK